MYIHLALLQPADLTRRTTTTSAEHRQSSLQRQKFAACTVPHTQVTMDFIHNAANFPAVDPMDFHSELPLDTMSTHEDHATTATFHNRPCFQGYGMMDEEEEGILKAKLAPPAPPQRSAGPVLQGLCEYEREDDYINGYDLLGNDNEDEENSMDFDPTTEDLAPHNEPLDLDSANLTIAPHNSAEHTYADRLQNKPRTYKAMHTFISGDSLYGDQLDLGPHTTLTGMQTAFADDARCCADILDLTGNSLGYVYTHDFELVVNEMAELGGYFNAVRESIVHKINFLIERGAAGETVMRAFERLHHFCGVAVDVVDEICEILRAIMEGGYELGSWEGVNGMESKLDGLRHALGGVDKVDGCQDEDFADSNNACNLTRSVQGVVIG